MIELAVLQHNSKAHYKYHINQYIIYWILFSLLPQSILHLFINVCMPHPHLNYIKIQLANIKPQSDLYYEKLTHILHHVKWLMYFNSLSKMSYINTQGSPLTKNNQLNYHCEKFLQRNIGPFIVKKQ